jgi:hypothetical protein
MVKLILQTGHKNLSLPKYLTKVVLQREHFTCFFSIIYNSPNLKKNIITIIHDKLLYTYLSKKISYDNKSFASTAFKVNKPLLQLNQNTNTIHFYHFPF